jgi:hypothetical protein
MSYGVIALRLSAFRPILFPIRGARVSAWFHAARDIVQQLLLKKIMLAPFVTNIISMANVRGIYSEMSWYLVSINKKGFGLPKSPRET